MPRYETSVVIAAPVAAVWQVTRDVESWPDWTPTVAEVTAAGPIAVGAAVRVRQPRLRPATWVVDHLDEPGRFCWHTGGPGYRLTADHLLRAWPDDTTTAVRLSVDMTGPLAWPLWLLVGPLSRRYVDREALALKRRCEQD